MIRECICRFFGWYCEDREKPFQSCLHDCFHPLVESALRTFIKNDKFLSKIDVNERSQTHKLAEYLQNMLPEYNVDCEYNRDMDKEKKLNFNKIVDAIKDWMNDQDNHNIRGNDNLSEIIKKFKKELNGAEPIFYDKNATTPNFLFVNNQEKSYILPVYPDIIAHLRGTHTNKIVIEAKKASNDKNDMKGDRFYDRLKLGLFTEHNGQFGYEVGYFIDLPSGDIPDKFKITFRKDDLVANSNVYIIEMEEIPQSVAGGNNE